MKGRDETRSYWLEGVIVLCVLSLVVQLVPLPLWSGVAAFGGTVLSYIDVRQWTWRSYAVVFGGAIAVLVIVKGRQDTR